MIESSLGKKNKLNNYLFPIYYWGFTFLNPIVSRVGSYSTLILLVFALVLFGLWFFVILKKRTINISVFVALGFLLLLVFDMLLRGNSLSFNYFYKYIYSGFLVVLFVSVINNSRETLKMFSILSVCAFFLFFYDPFLDYMIFGDYMGYGFGLALPAFIGMGVGFTYFKKRILILPMLACLFMLLIYANRSSFLAAVIFILLYLLIMHRKKRMFLGLLIFAILATFLLLEHIVLFTMNLLIEMDISTYAINQFVRLLQHGDPSDFFSGRFDIWQNAWNMFLAKPRLGHGAGYFHSVYGTYPHNIILDVLVTYGIIGLLAIGILMLLPFYKLVKSKNENKLLGLVFLTLWFPKLIFSVYFIGDRGFWAFIAYGFLFLGSVGVRQKEEVKDGKS